MNLRKVLARVALAGGVACFAACGGGGDGGAGDAAGSPAPAAPPATATSPNGAAIVSTVRSSEFSQAMTWRAAVEVLERTFPSATQLSADAPVETGDFRLDPGGDIAPDGRPSLLIANLIVKRKLEPGTHSGILRIGLCTSHTCADGRPGEVREVPYQITVVPGARLTVSVNGVAVDRTAQTPTVKRGQVLRVETSEAVVWNPQDPPGFRDITTTPTSWTGTSTGQAIGATVILARTTAAPVESLAPSIFLE